MSLVRQEEVVEEEEEEEELPQEWLQVAGGSLSSVKIERKLKQPRRHNRRGQDLDLNLHPAAPRH